ncbi:MAG: cupin domain-containing protein [Anaerolineae bacterium]|nr:cupin domain-containing protein [Anaerolineae bacterium]
MTDLPGSKLVPAGTDGAGAADQPDDEQPWEPAPLPESAFITEAGWTNINRAPYDRIAGVLYKRAMAIKSVSYAPLDPAPELPEMWRGHGETVVRWLFSEEPGTAEGLLQQSEFRALQSLRLAPGAATGQRRHPGRDTILFVIAGRGTLSHRASLGVPVVQRPLREGDVVLIAGDERYSLANDDALSALYVLALHLGTPAATQAAEQDG